MDIRNGTVTSRDGTKLATYAAGPDDAPVMVLCNGLGGNILAWRNLVDSFEDRYRILSWDYRGIYRSGQPPHREDDDFDMTHQCDDLDAVLGAEGVDRAIFFGWSMGVQLAFEYYRRAPERFVGLVQINGTSGLPLDTAFRTRCSRPVVPMLLETIQRLSPLLAAAEPLFSRTRVLVALFKAVGLVSPMLDETIFRDLVRDFLHQDFDSYARTFRCLARHDASDMLPTVAVPTLLIAGDKDVFTPPEITRNMADRIPGAEYLIIHGGTHYTPAEYPMVVNLRIEKFFRERLGLC